MIRIGFICPTYNATVLHKYTKKSLESFFDTTPNGVAIVVDDGSANWSNAYENSLKAIATKLPGSEIHFIHFPKNGGLTRSWNAGLSKAKELNLTHAIAGNNDVVFTNNWHAGLLHAAENGYSLIGPLSNAPGITAKGNQEISRFYAGYRLTDSQVEINKVASTLYKNNLGKVIESRINGFFLFAKMTDWQKGMYDAQHYFRPVNPKTADGRRNPTPLMTLNEDELQSRWAAKGMKSAVCLSSFIFHYRAVSRGDTYKLGKWFRQA
jgi:glycosyltransferase involved in cell wall biosynthesis